MKKREMSKEEVLRTLEKLANDYLVYPDETVALDYAIKAVKALDCVYDPAYIKYYANWYGQTYGDFTPQEVADIYCVVDNEGK